MTLVQNTSGPDDQGLIESARGANEDAYRELIEVHRSELHAHCYRMLASVEEAGDLVSDVTGLLATDVRGFEPRRSSLASNSRLRYRHKSGHLGTR